MKQDDFKKIQADLNERINKNKEMVNSYFTKLKIFKKNSFEERFFSIFSYGSFIWFL